MVPPGFTRPPTGQLAERLSERAATLLMVPTQSPTTGLLLPSREALLWAHGDLGLVVEAGRKAEEAGYGSVWVGDSLLARPRGEPLVLLAAVAGATNRVTLGTAVLLPLLRHPVSLAHALATLDRVAQGRLVVGVGPGAELPGTHAELKAVGVPSDKRVGAMLGALDRCRRLWRGEETGLDVQPRPWRPDGPPIWIGGGGPRMLRETGAKFDGWLPLSPTPADYATGLRAVLEAAERAGRDPSDVSTGVYLTMAVADTSGEAKSQLDAYMDAYYGVPAQVMAPTMALHAGTPESAAEWVAAYREAGAKHVVVRLARPRLDGYHDAARQLLASAQP